MMLTSEENQINVMIVNDSPFMIEMLKDLITHDSRIKVSSTARDGLEALNKIKYIPTDVVLLDLEMPNMDGLTFIEKSMKEKSIPIIVVSSYSKTGAKLVLDSLELGAVDFVSISHNDPSSISNLGNVLVSKIDVASRSNPNVLAPKAISKLKPYSSKYNETKNLESRVVVIGASTGAPRVITNILKDIPSDIPASFLIVQHMSKDFISTFTRRLNDVSKIKVREASDGDAIKEGNALIAPGDFHMLVRSPNHIELNQGPKRFGSRPSVNATMVSASEVFGANTIGILLSGMGQDGAFGMRMIKKRHGITLAQNESSSIIFGMAKAAQEMDAVDKMVDADNLISEIVKAVTRPV
jgi:two-component system chemotaxis response regulator CheB